MQVVQLYQQAKMVEEDYQSHATAHQHLQMQQQRELDALEREIKLQKQLKIEADRRLCPPAVARLTAALGQARCCGAGGILSA